MSGVNYSRWEHIEVSDDEDDTHPNIDTPSLFRWRHQARVERDSKFAEEKADYENKLKCHIKKYNDCVRDVKKAREENADNLKELEKKMEVLDVENKEWDKRKEEWQKKERLKPLNIDSICHDGISKTIVNSAATKFDEKVENDDESAIDRLKDFVTKNKKIINKFGMFKRPIDTQNFLIENPHLVCDETANQLVLWCINLAMEEKFDLLNHVSHQGIVMQFMLELAKSLKCDPRAVIRPFFAKFLNPEPEYLKAFQDELEAFRTRIRNRAKVRVEEAVEKYEAEEKEKRLGPGGLDPIDVFETLPKELQECFESKDVNLLKTTLVAMDPKDAEYYMQRCISSGLWVENAEAENENTETSEIKEKDNADHDDNDDDNEKKNTEKEKKEEAIYATMQEGDDVASPNS